MGSCCDHSNQSFTGASRAFRRALIVVIAINAVMFLVETGAGLLAGSMALRADALDFLGDALTYGLSLAVIGRADTVRASAAMLKGVTLAVMGVWVMVETLTRLSAAIPPEPITMSVIGTLALAANLISVVLLMRWRNGDANVRSVWLCSRNDAIGNVAVVLAAAGVFGTGSALPDLIVACAMATLFLSPSVRILQQAGRELALARA